MADRVRLRHPETGGEWDCPANAADAWQDKGWERVTLEGMSKPELESYAAERGVNLSSATTKADMVAAIESEGV